AGIQRHLTAPYSPQQNGVVEHRNRSVMAMARSLLKGMLVPGRFLGEAVRHAVYLLNRLLTKAMGDWTPFEAWTGRKPQLGHLRVFGCTAHAKITTPNQKKLDDRSTPYVYLGVVEGSKAHRLFDPRRGRIHVSRDVIFEENVPWQWSAVAGEQNSTEFTVEEDGVDAPPAHPVPRYRAPSPAVPQSHLASPVGASPSLPTSP
uniref:Integrase catalytic domain-containing protein n=1 Tax=Oryza glaberrima TaxID=4538 RepID=I1QKJ2_ORYGL